jgi:hypothetical protein
MGHPLVQRGALPGPLGVRLSWSRCECTGRGGAQSNGIAHGFSVCCQKIGLFEVWQHNFVLWLRIVKRICCQKIVLPEFRNRPPLQFNSVPQCSINLVSLYVINIKFLATLATISRNISKIKYLALLPELLPDSLPENQNGLATAQRSPRIEKIYSRPFRIYSRPFSSSPFQPTGRLLTARHPPVTLPLCCHLSKPNVWSPRHGAGTGRRRGARAALYSSTTPHPRACAC